MDLGSHLLIQVFNELHCKVISFGENDKSKVTEWHQRKLYTKVKLDI